MPEPRSTALLLSETSVAVAIGLSNLSPEASEFVGVPDNWKHVVQAAEVIETYFCDSWRSGERVYEQDAESFAVIAWPPLLEFASRQDSERLNTDLLASISAWLRE